MQSHSFPRNWFDTDVSYEPLSLGGRRIVLLIDDLSPQMVVVKSQLHGVVVICLWYLTTESFRSINEKWFRIDSFQKILLGIEEQIWHAIHKLFH